MTASPEGDDGPAAGPGPDPGDELVEWIDDDGRVLEVVSRRRMRAEGLGHRCTYVVVAVGPVDRFAAAGAADRLDPATEIVVHLRADWKDVTPSHWDLAFGGVCGVGEDWATSARRELAEEAGIELGPDDPLIDLGAVRYVDETTGDAGTVIHGRAFLVAWPGRPRSVDGEAVAFGRVTLTELPSWMASRPVCPDSAAVVAPAVLARVAES